MLVDLNLELNADASGRSLASKAGSLAVEISAELGRLLVAHKGDKRQALAAGFADLARRKTLHAKEAKELAELADDLFADGIDATRVAAYVHALEADHASSTAALAIASVLHSVAAPPPGPGRSLAKAGGPNRNDTGLVLGAVIGAGVGGVIGGFVGAGIGAVVGAVAGVCAAKA